MEPSFLWKAFTASIPVVSALTWLIIMLLAMEDSKGNLERKVKKVLVFYFLSVMMNWIFLAIYIYMPQMAPYTNSITLFSFFLPVITFYHFIYLLTTTRANDRFPVWHYVTPLCICLCLQVWSFFIPLEIQVDLFRNRGELSTGYEAYSRFSLSKPYLRLIFSFVYSCIGIAKLMKYYQKSKENNDLINKPIKWFVLLISLSIALLIVSISAILAPRGGIYDSGGVIASYCVMIALHITIGYNVIRRNFLLYIPSHLIDEQENKIETDQLEEQENKLKRIYTRRTQIEVTQSGKLKHKKLSKSVFETYFKKHKPFLNPQLKITDLLDPLNTNRTILSGFVNKTYGMNFNQYINFCRLKELDRLQTKAANKTEDVKELIIKVGFANQRNYNRALEAQQTDSNRRNNQL